MKRTNGMRAFAVMAAGLALMAGGALAASGQPDLTVQVLASAGGGTAFTAGHLFGFDYPQLIVKNVGNAPAAHWIATYRCKPVPNSGLKGTTPPCPTQAEEKFGTISSSVLAPGQTSTPLWVHWTDTQLQVGKYVLSGTVESNEDSNKSNDYQEITITVSQPSIPINFVLAAPTLVSLAAMSPIEPASVMITYREHSANRPAKGFIIERKAGGGTFQQVATVVPSGPVKIDKGNGIERTYKDGGLKLETAYIYRLKAYDGKGESGYSNEESITIKKPSKPPTPQIIEK